MPPEKTKSDLKACGILISIHSLCIPASHMRGLTRKRSKKTIAHAGTIAKESIY